MKLIILIFSLLVLVGCSVSSEDIQWAEKKCRNNEGIKKLECSFTLIMVTCNDGMQTQK